MNYTYTLFDRRHKELGSFTRAADAIDAMEADDRVSYIDRDPEPIVIARRMVHVNPVWEKEFLRHGDRVSKRG